MSTWFDEHPPQERAAMLQEIVGLMEAGRFEAPEVEVVNLSIDGMADELAGSWVRDATRQMLKGYSSKKWLLQFHR
jgi:hypothetical protein